MVAAAQDSGSKPDPHAQGKVTVPVGASEVTYCKSCHTSGCPTQHPELVKLTWSAQGRVVLGVSGEITCGSCHSRGFRHLSDAFLGQDQKRLCGSCHYGAHTITNAHSSDPRCESCHASAAAARAQPPTPQSRVMISGVDSECMRCHYDGPITHPIGIANSKKKAPDLPLAADGTITCVTCHVGHQQQDRFGTMLRKDNRHGGLCLSCHDDL